MACAFVTAFRQFRHTSQGVLQIPTIEVAWEVVQVLPLIPKRRSRETSTAENIYRYDTSNERFDASLLERTSL